MRAKIASLILSSIFLITACESPTGPESDSPELNIPLISVVTSISPTQVQLEWIDHSRIEDGFIIDRRADENNYFEEIGRTRANETVYIDNTLDPDFSVWYQYRIRAFTPRHFSEPLILTIEFIDGKWKLV